MISCLLTKCFRKVSCRAITLCFNLFAVFFLSLSNAYAGPEEQAKRIHERLTGVIPSGPTLSAMVNELSGTDTDGNSITGGLGAAYIAMVHPAFYSATIKNWAAPWTNREQDVFVPLNDYTATVIGFVKQDVDFRRILYGNEIGYSPRAISDGFPYSSVWKAPDDDSIDHYQYVENNNLIDTIVLGTQPAVTGLNNVPPAGIMTTHAAAKAFFVDGTNRAMLRYTLLNHLCVDLEQLHDVTRPADRIRQDVSRSPGGDSTQFLTGCVGCHSGMDPMAQAFAYYDYDNDLVDEDNNDLNPTYSIVYDRSQVNPKYHINSTTFPYGYVTPDDHWDNYWRTGQNSALGWGAEISPNERNGAESLGRELANSAAFTRCQVEKVFKNVCLRDPISTDDVSKVSDMIRDFTSGYLVKPLFAAAADYCKTPL